MLTVPFSLLPGSSRLFVDYCNGAPDVRNYFVGHYTDPMAYAAHVEFLERRTYHREALCAVLRSQNTRFSSGPAAFAHIDALSDSRTFAVFTGQQVGVFSGALYTIYKALTAVHTAKWLAEILPAYRFIPMFWLETEDHDIEEASVTGTVNRDNNFVTIRYGDPPDPEVKSLHPVGSIVFDERIERAITELADACPQTEFTAHALEVLRSCYQSGATFADAFARYINAVYPDAGIVFVDPSDPGIKRFLSPVILQELETYPTSGEEVIKRSAELEERYHAQVKPRAVNLFFLHKSSRYPIEPGDDGFFLRGTRQHFTRDDLLETANVSPESFSPNVLLRPVFQDYLFPTCAYIAGPAEVAYFAQLQPVYDHFQIPMPIIVPRASISIVEKKLQKVFNKLDLPYAAMFDDPEDIYARLARNGGNDAQATAFFQLRSEMDALMHRLPGTAASIDPNLAEPAAATAQRMGHYLGILEERVIQARRDRDSVVRRQLEKMQMYLAPEGAPQERRLTLHTFLNRYGTAILQDIERECVPFPAEHRLLLL